MIDYIRKNPYKAHLCCHLIGQILGYNLGYILTPQNTTLLYKEINGWLYGIGTAFTFNFLLGMNQLAEKIDLPDNEDDLHIIPLMMALGEL